MDLFHVEGMPTHCTLRAGSRITELTARLAHGYSVQSVSGGVNLKIPPLLECNDIRNSRSETPTPGAAQRCPQLESIVHFITPLELEAGMSLLHGRDAYKVRQIATVDMHCRPRVHHGAPPLWSTTWVA